MMISLEALEVTTMQQCHQVTLVNAVV